MKFWQSFDDYHEIYFSNIWKNSRLKLSLYCKLPNENDMTAIYWNTNKQNDFDRISDILSDVQPDVMFLSEINEDVIQAKQEKINVLNYEYFENPGCNRVKILKHQNFPLELHLQNNYFTIVRNSETDIYVVSLHFPSQMYQHLDSLKEFIRDFRTTLDLEIGSSSEKKVLIIGDFNVNPFEKPMIDFDGFLATNSSKSRTSVTHLTKNRTTYYNPTWKLYSRNHFPGTKAFTRPSGASYDIIEHHFLDQVVISQQLRSTISEENISVIEKTKNFIFFDEKRNKVVGSDHLPLLYNIKIV
jgi:exonuclease III